VAERSAPPLLLAATAEVLRPHAPFDAMRAEDLAFLAGHLRLRYYADAAILDQLKQNL